jgi:cytochrome c biogenesis protein CcmG/thiol:disulfide interchange protein DsbE
MRLRDMSRTAKVAAVASALLIAMIAAVSLADNGARAVPRGLPAASSFTLRELGHPGQKVSLAAFDGRPVIVNFFASWCAPCKRETPTLARFYRESGARTAIIGVDSNDQPGPALRFVRAAGVRYPVGVDPLPASTTISYGVIALPQTFFLNAQHRIVKRVFGPVTMKELSEGVALMSKGSRGTPPATPSASAGSG